MSTPRSVTDVRRMTPADLPFADEVRALARWNQTRRDWQGYLEFEPEGCFVAEVDGQPAGTATTITYGGRVGWIGMVLVHPRFQRRGVGTELLHTALQYLRDRRITSIKLDATPMGRSVYLPLGFHDEYTITRFEGVAPAVSDPPRGPVAFAEADFAEIVALDAAGFGTERSAVLADISRRHPQLCFALHEGSSLTGYLIAREGANAVHLGPWIARDAAAASRLLPAFFQRVSGRKVVLDIPDENSAGQRLLLEHGFTVQRGYTRMVLGPNPYPGDPKLVFGGSGAEKG